MARRANGEKTKAERIADEVARVVGAGRAVSMETVDFNDPNRPKTCLEVNFPILPVNQVAVIEGNAGKPIYQMSKWWARRRSSVFRSMLLAAAMKAPEDESQAAQAVWDVYYANHQKKGAFKKLKVADIFMGGGTTVVEGSRLGMQMLGNDLNPVAWFVVKTELAQVTKQEIEALLADIESDVKPQIMPYFACRGPDGERGTWTQRSSGKVMGDDFDPLGLTPEERKNYAYEGPEIIYVFWAKHVPCQATGCGHRTPIMSTPVIAVKELSITAWEHTCKVCKANFDVEEGNARMAPDIPLVEAPGDTLHAVAGSDGRVVCPACGKGNALPHLGKGKKKKVSLTLVAHPSWLAGTAATDSSGTILGGSVTDDAASTSPWLRTRASQVRLLEVRGTLPEEVTCPETGVTFSTSTGTVPKDAHFACGACGMSQRNVVATHASGKSAPTAPVAIQAYSPKRDREGRPYGGRYFVPADDSQVFEAASREWEARRDTDLAMYWPRVAIPFGHMTHERQPLPQHGYLHWADMFNPRQLLVNALLLKAINEVNGQKHRWEAREFVLGAFQQYLRNQNMFCFWDVGYDKLVPHMSNNNYHPKSMPVENCVFARLGRGNWLSCTESLLETLEWRESPWEIVSTTSLTAANPDLSEMLSGKSQKVSPSDPVLPAHVQSGSATDLTGLVDASYDLVITDPPFGGNLHYSELADFFYVWLRLVLKTRYPDQFAADHTPKTLEAVSNPARNPDDADAYYQRLLTASWREAYRILKPGGTLAFTFHHSEDEPWVSVLESLFEAGFYLEATYPIRSDETKGEGEFGSKKIEYDIVHVCRKRLDAPTPVSWARMRRRVMQDVLGLKHLLEHHQRAGLPEPDLQVIRCGKALEYFSRHYGQVFVSEEQPLSVKDALVGIKQLLDESAGMAAPNPPPADAHPTTRQFLRLFDRTTQRSRDEVHKTLRGSVVSGPELLALGWCREEKKVFHLVPHLELARAWQGKHRKNLTSDYEQAAVLIGACYEGSGIDVSKTLQNEQFKPHPALEALLEWFGRHGADPDARSAAQRALKLFRTAKAKAEFKAPVNAELFADPVDA